MSPHPLYNGIYYTTNCLSENRIHKSFEKFCGFEQRNHWRPIDIYGENAIIMAYKTYEQVFICSDLKTAYSVA